MSWDMPRHRNRDNGRLRLIAVGRVAPPEGGCEVRYLITRNRQGQDARQYENKADEYTHMIVVVFTSTAPVQRISRILGKNVRTRRNGWIRGAPWTTASRGWRDIQPSIRTE